MFLERRLFQYLYIKCTTVAACVLVLLMFSGTGSGVGTYILNLLEEDYPDVYR